MGGGTPDCGEGEACAERGPLPGGACLGLAAGMASASSPSSSDSSARFVCRPSTDWLDMQAGRHPNSSSDSSANEPTGRACKWNDRRGSLGSTRSLRLQG